MSRLPDIIDWVLPHKCAFCNNPPYAIYRSEDGEEILACREHGKHNALRIDLLKDPESTVLELEFVPHTYEFVGKLERW